MTKAIEIQTEASAALAVAPSAEPANLTGRSIFLVETTHAGIAVQTSFMTEDGKLLQLPAIFPELPYALEQIDMLRNLVIRHFSQAAQVGAQVIAAQAQQAAPAVV